LKRWGSTLQKQTSGAARIGPLGPFEELLAVLSRPFDDQSEFFQYQNPPLEDERVLATFCGT
jgi:uncharacterized protein YdiU (UPF0061 family)